MLTWGLVARLILCILWYCGETWVSIVCMGQYVRLNVHTNRAWAGPTVLVA